MVTILHKRFLQLSALALAGNLLLVGCDKKGMSTAGADQQKVDGSQSGGATTPENVTTDPNAALPTDSGSNGTTSSTETIQQPEKTNDFVNLEFGLTGEMNLAGAFADAAVSPASFIIAVSSGDAPASCDDPNAKVVTGDKLKELQLAPNSGHTIMICAGANVPGFAPGSVITQQNFISAAAAPMIAAIKIGASNMTELQVDTAANPAETEYAILIKTADGKEMYFNPADGLAYPTALQGAVQVWFKLQKPLGLAATTSTVQTIATNIPADPTLNFAIKARNKSGINTPVSPLVHVEVQPAAVAQETAPSEAPASSAPVATEPAVEPVAEVASAPSVLVVSEPVASAAPSAPAVEETTTATTSPNFESLSLKDKIVFVKEKIEELITDRVEDRHDLKELAQDREEVKEALAKAESSEEPKLVEKLAAVEAKIEEERKEIVEIKTDIHENRVVLADLRSQSEEQEEVKSKRDDDHDSDRHANNDVKDRDDDDHAKAMREDKDRDEKIKEEKRKQEEADKKAAEEAAEKKAKEAAAAKKAAEEAAEKKAKEDAAAKKAADEAAEKKAKEEAAAKKAAEEAAAKKAAEDAAAKKAADEAAAKKAKSSKKK